MRARSRLALPFMALLAACSSEAPSPPAWGTLEITPPSATLNTLTYAEIRLVVTARDTAGIAFGPPPLAWKSSDDAIAMVDSTGVVQAIAAGNAIVTASSKGVSASSAVTVEPVSVADVAGTWTFRQYFFKSFCNSQAAIHVIQGPSDAAFHVAESLPGCGSTQGGYWTVYPGAATGFAANGRLSMTSAKCQYSGILFHVPIDSMTGLFTCATVVYTSRDDPGTRAQVHGRWIAVRQ